MSPPPVAEAGGYDLYDVLNLRPGASAEDVKAAFRELSRAYHPDKQTAVGRDAPRAGAEDAFMRVHRAYRVLGDATLRPFYDRYGSAGVQLAENLSDDEGDGQDEDCGEPDGLAAAGRLARLERRVFALMRRKEELRTQRALGLQGSLTIAVAAQPPDADAESGAVSSAWCRRRPKLQFCSTSQFVRLATIDGVQLNVGCVAHAQEATGSGMGKFVAAVSSQVGPRSSVRASGSFTGGAPELDATLVRNVSEHLTVQQRFAYGRGGPSISVSLFPWLSRTARGNVNLTAGADPSLSIGAFKRSTSAGHSVSCSLSSSARGLSVECQAKYKPVKQFALKVAPSLSAKGLAVETTCIRHLDDGLTKLHWALNLRRGGALARLTLSRTGNRLSLPLELWPEAAGPLQPADFAVLLAIWALPPFVASACWALFQRMRPREGGK